MTLRNLIGACAWTVLGLAAAGAGHAQTVTADFTIYDTSESTVITSPGFTGTSYASPFQMTVTAGAPIQSLYVFCIDVYQELGPSETGLTYAQTPLTNYDGGTGTTLTGAQATDMSRLIGYGESLIATDPTDPNLAAELAGVQDAIWTVEYSGAGYSFTATDAAAAGYETSDLAMLSTLPDDPSVSAFVSTDGQTQAMGGGPGIIISNSGAPEPGAWAMMILGLGLTGASLRRRVQAV